MNTIDEDKYGQITHDVAKKCLRMNWFPATGEMTAEEFKRTLTVAADAALAHGVESILVDTRDFRPNPALEDLCAWRVENIVPKYNQVLKRFAWITGAELSQLPGGGDSFQNAGETYQSRFFREEAAAIAWVTTSA